MEQFRIDNVLVKGFGTADLAYDTKLKCTVVLEEVTKGTGKRWPRRVIRKRLSGSRSVDLWPRRG